MKKYFAASLAMWVLVLVWDNFLSGMFIGSAMSAIPGAVESFSKFYESLGDLFVALVFVALYARTRSIFGENPGGGATYGVYAGLLGNFPTWLFMTVYFGWPYKSAWTLTIAMVCLMTVCGAMVGAIYKAMGSPKAA